MSGLYSSRAKTPDNTPFNSKVMLACLLLVAAAMYFFVEQMTPDKPLVADETRKTVQVNRK